MTPRLTVTDVYLWLDANERRLAELFGVLIFGNEMRIGPVQVYVEKTLDEDWMFVILRPGGVDDATDHAEAGRKVAALLRAEVGRIIEAKEAAE